MFPFVFRGGVSETDKFLLFHIVEGAEFSFYEFQKMGLVTSSEEAQYFSAHPVIKLFVYKQPERTSFFIRLMTRGGQRIEIKSFNTKHFLFEAPHAEIIDKRRAIKLLKNPKAIRFIQTEKELTKDQYNRMVRIDRRALVGKKTRKIHV